jgi:hypothetical protein
VGIVQVEIVRVALADNDQADLAARAVQAVLADNVRVGIVQAEIVPAVLVDNVQVQIVQPELVADLLVQVHQEQRQVAHQVADQVVARIQRAVAETQPARLVNLVADLRRVVSQSVPSVKSSTT